MLVGDEMGTRQILQRDLSRWHWSHTWSEPNADGTYAIPAGTLFTPQLGLKLGLGKSIALMAAAGYGFSLDNHVVVHSSGQDTEALRSLAEALAPGGLSATGTLVVRF